MDLLLERTGWRKDSPAAFGGRSGARPLPRGKCCGACAFSLSDRPLRPLLSQNRESALQGIVESFTEGFETEDFRDASGILSSLEERA